MEILSNRQIRRGRRTGSQARHDRHLGRTWVRVRDFTSARSRAAFANALGSATDESKQTSAEVQPGGHQRPSRKILRSVWSSAKQQSPTSNGTEWRTVRRVRRKIRLSEINRTILGMRVEHAGSRAISRRRPFYSSIVVWLEHLWRWSERSPHRSSDLTRREICGLVLDQGLNRGFRLGRPRQLKCRVCRRRGDRHFLVRDERFAASAVEDPHISRL